MAPALRPRAFINAIQTSPGESKGRSFKTPAQALGAPRLRSLQSATVKRPEEAGEYVHQDSFLFSSSERCCEVPDRSARS